MALAHTIGNKVEAAYRRGDLLERRRALMVDWADYCYSSVQRWVCLTGQEERPVAAPEYHYSEASSVRAQAVRELEQEREAKAQDQAQRLTPALHSALRKEDSPLPIERFWQNPRYGSDFNPGDLASRIHALG